MKHVSDFLHMVAAYKDLKLTTFLLTIFFKGGGSCFGFFGQKPS